MVAQPTRSDKIKLLFSKRKLPKLLYIFLYGYGENVMVDTAIGYKMNDYYVIPKLNTRMPLPPRKAIMPALGYSGAVIVMVPERDIYKYVVPKTKEGKKKAEEVVFALPPKISREDLKIFGRESDFRLLYIESRKDLEKEEKALQTTLQKVIPIVSGFIAILGLAIILYVVTNQYSKVVNLGIESLKAFANAHKTAVAQNTATVVNGGW